MHFGFLLSDLASQAYSMDFELKIGGFLCQVSMPMWLFREVTFVPFYLNPSIRDADIGLVKKSCGLRFTCYES